MGLSHLNKGWLMNLTTSLKLKKLFITMLSFLLAFCLMFTCACNDGTTDDDDGDDDTTTEETTISDAQTLNNGDFEFYTTDKTAYPYSSSVKWTRSNDSDKSSAPTSSYSSGIIDVSSTAYGALADKNKPLDTINSTDTDKKYLNPQTPHYYGLIDNKYDAEDEETHANPNTSGSKILMIHNQLNSTPNHGTAQYFTSSTTLNVAKNSYAKFSVWIKTQNLNSNILSDGEYGAYVLLKNTVNSVEYNDIVFNNIDTKGQWSLFETYIKGDELFDITFKVVFGLGQGNGTNHTKFVEGFAYFDNAKFETYTKKEFNSLTLPTTSFDVKSDSEYDIDLGSTAYAPNGDKKDYDANNSTYYTTTSCVLNYNFIPIYSALDMNSVSGDYNYDVRPTGNIFDLSNGNKKGAGSVNSIKSTLSQTSQDALDNIDTELGVTNPNLIYFDFANPSTASQTIDNLEIKAKSYIRYTFYSKIKISNSSANKFKVEIIDTTNANNEKKTAVFSSLGTTTVKDGEYGSWEKYDIYVANVTDADVEYSLKFTFGIDEGKIAQNAELTEGYAFIADLKSYTTQNEEEFEKYDEIYSSLSSSSNLYKISLLGKYSNYEDEEDETETSDNYSISVDLSQQFEITKNPVTNIKNDYNLDKINEKTVYGVINTKYINNYTQNVGDKAYLKDTLASDESLQLLMLNNTDNVNSYLETYKSNLGENSVLKISVTVAVKGNAKAYVNLRVKNDNGGYDDATISGNDNAWTKNITVNATETNISTLGQKFINLTMYVATGNRGFDYKLQIGNEGLGAVYIKNISTVTSTLSDFISEREILTDDFATISGLEFGEEEYTRLPATVKSLDEDGNEVESTRTFEPTVVFSGNNLYKFIDYTTIDVESVIDETDQVEDEEEDTEEDPTNPSYVNEKSVALEIISILLSVVLLGVLITVLVRNIIKDRRKRIVKTKNYYSRDSRDKALNAISEKKKNINVDDDDEEYDYTLAEKVGEDDDTVTEEIIDLETLTQAPIDDSQTTEETTDDSQTQPTDDQSDAEQVDDAPSDNE